MLIEHWTGPPAETHGYLVADEEAGEAWAIDAPLRTAEPLLEYAGTHNLRVSRLVLTHAHFDHILDAERYHERGIPIVASALERPILEAPQDVLFGLPYPMPRIPIDEELEDGAQLRLGSLSWEVWHTPGHSPGHVVLYCRERSVLFGGDMLFDGGYGRIDLPGTDAGQMAASLRRLAALPRHTRVYAGHGPATTVGDELGWLEPMLARGLY